MKQQAPPRALITAAAAELLHSLQQRHGPVMFHQSGGCCDGSSPMCYPPDGDFIVGDRDVLLGGARRCPPGVDLRPAIRDVETHPAGDRRRTRSRWRLQLGSPRGHAFFSEPGGPSLHRRGKKPVAGQRICGDRSRLRAWRPPRRTGRPGGRRRSRRLCNPWSARRSRSAIVRTTARTLISVIPPLPRAWLLTSALLVGTVTGLVAAVVATLLVKTPVRPDLVVGLVVAVPSVIGMLLILFSGRRWMTTVGGAFILAMAPGWLGALVLVQVVSHG